MSWSYLNSSVKKSRRKWKNGKKKILKRKQSLIKGAKHWPEENLENLKFICSIFKLKLILHPSKFSGPADRPSTGPVAYQCVKLCLILCFRHEKILKKERIKKIMEYEKELDGVKNMIDCQGYRENECRKYSYEFKRDVVNRPKPVSSR